MIPKIPLPLNKLNKFRRIQNISKRRQNPERTQEFS